MYVMIYDKYDFLVTQTLHPIWTFLKYIIILDSIKFQINKQIKKNAFII